MSKSIIAIADAGRRRPENVFGETDATRLAGRLSPQSATGRDPALNIFARLHHGACDGAPLGAGVRAH